MRKRPAAPATPPAVADVAANELIERCRLESLQLLEACLTPRGILAARRSAAAEARSYTRIFGRDAGVCALAMFDTGNAALEAGAVASLDALAALQAPNGQIPKYVDPERQDADFWYLGCIDATLWWLIAVEKARRGGHAPASRWQRNVDLALQWLHAQEHQRFYLLQQNEASDWADIMPRSGFVLYTNALWHRVKGLYGLVEREATHHHFNHLFHPYRSDLPEYRRGRLLRHYAVRSQPRGALYLSFVNFSFAGMEGDVFGNLLAILCDLASDSRAHEIVSALRAEGAADPYPIRVVLHPLPPGHALWRAYMARHQQNQPHQYHNGGIWPFVGGFWVLVAQRLGMHELARSELVRLAQANAVGNWRFTEWLHGRTLVPMGMAGQAWNAATFLLAHRALAGGGPVF